MLAAGGLERHQAVALEVGPVAAPDQVGGAHEVGDERCCGAGRRSRPGVPICSITPSRMTTMRSEMASASSRSWVT